MLQALIRYRAQASPHIPHPLGSLCKFLFTIFTSASASCFDFSYPFSPLVPSLNDRALTCLSLFHTSPLSSQVYTERPSLQVALRAVPRRPEFYARISQGGSIEKLDAELARWLGGLDSLVKHLSAFLEQGGYGKV